MKIRHFTTIFFVSVLTMYSQQENGLRFINKSSWQGYWYDSSTAMYQVKLPIIRTFPPVNSGMSYDIMMSYIKIDSVARFCTNKQALDLLKSFTRINDTLRYGAKYLYMLKDYDAALFRQYEEEVSMNQKQDANSVKLLRTDETRLDSIAPNTYWWGFYSCSLKKISQEFINKFCSLIPANEENAVRALLMSDYIVHIRIISIDSTPNKNASLEYNRYKVTAQVIDTLKGKTIKATSYYLPGSIIVNNENEENVKEMRGPGSSVINFQYSPKNYIGYGWSSGDYNGEQIRDDAFTDYKGEFIMSVGQEAIVFLKFANSKLDFENDYFDLDVCPYCSNNALPVINGNVRDMGHFWSNSQSVKYSDWKSGFNEIMNKILNLQY